MKSADWSAVDRKRETSYRAQFLQKGGAYHCRLAWMRNSEAKQFQVLFLLILTGRFQLHIRKLISSLVKNSALVLPFFQKVLLLPLHAYFEMLPSLGGQKELVSLDSKNPVSLHVVCLHHNFSFWRGVSWIPLVNTNVNFWRGALQQ